MKDLDETETDKKPSKKERLIIANQKIEELEKKLAEQVQYKEMYQRERNNLQGEIDQLHDFLDGLGDDVMPKTKASGYGDNSVSTRLLSWIAKR